MACFEAAIPLLDEINNIVSNACDGVEQFIQSLAIAVNCEFPEDTTITDIRKAGMIALRSIGENKADFRVLTEQLDQTQTKVLVDRLYDQALRISAMPARSSGQSTQSTTGAAVLANFGWYQASSAARNSEDLYMESNRQFDAIVVDILKRKGLLDISINDFEPMFSHGETENVQGKAQAYQTLMAAGMHPELAMAKSGISNDPVKDAAMSEKYINMVWGNPDVVDKAEKTNGGKGEAIIVEEDRNNGMNETGGAV
jgi:SPP1 family phage portal protein